MSGSSSTAPDSPLLVVIDGPAGAGKTTVARRVAEALSLPLLDTGAIYRTLALVAHRRGVPWTDDAGLSALATDFPIAFEQTPGAGQIVRFGGEDVSAAIRTPEMSQGASKVSALPGVRKALLGIQRALGATGCVAEGRDMGTVVFPDARHKFFVTADLQARAQRRRGDLVAAAPT
ncbi:MAG: (d)CMP kinase [Myxococcota bacterium]